LEILKRLSSYRQHPGVTLVRVGLPLSLLVAGVILMSLGSFNSKTSTTAAIGLVLAGIALMVWMLNWMFRMSVESNVDREREELAREYFDKHGHWPDEPEP
jgi:hypothetical protein